MSWSKTLCSAPLLLLLVPAVANATVISYGANIEFSGAQAPAGSSPWIVASFDDHGGVGSVDFMLTATNLTGTENVESFYFNLDPTKYGLLPLSFSSPTKIGSFDTPSISQGIDAFMADGDGKYDVLLGFSPGGNPSKTFSNGDQLKYTITGAGLTASSFDFLSQPAGGHGPFYFAAHSQNTTGAGSGGSGWITGSHVPEPSSVLLANLACLGAIAFRRHR